MGAHVHAGFIECSAMQHPFSQGTSAHACTCMLCVRTLTIEAQAHAHRTLTPCVPLNHRYNLTALPAGGQLTVRTQTLGGRFTKLTAKIELVWVSSQQDSTSRGPSSPSPSPATDAVPLPGAPSPSPSPAPGGAKPADESSTVVTTPAPIHMDPSLINTSDGNLTFFPLLNFTVPPAFSPTNNNIELWTR